MHLGHETTTKDPLEVVVRAVIPVRVAVCPDPAAVRIPVRIPVLLAIVIAVPVDGPVHGPVEVAVAAGLLHLAVGCGADVGVARLEAAGGAGVAGAHGGEEVDVEGEDVEGEDEGDGPLEHGGGVGGLLEVAGGEGDGEDDLDDDEGELDVEGYAEDAVGGIVCLRDDLLLVFAVVERVCVCGREVKGGRTYGRRVAGIPSR